MLRFLQCITVLLILSSQSFAELGTESDAALIDEFNLVKTNVMLTREEWDDNPIELDKDDFRFKGQNSNTMSWDDIDPLAWYDLNTWKKRRAIKDENADWKQKFRETRHTERIGKVLKCVGLCQMYRGAESNSIEYKTRIYEGDEVFTGANSSLWIMLVDGSLIRFLSNTSVTLLEFNTSKKKMHSFIRLNYGYIHFETRGAYQYETLNKPETDLGFYPIQELKANREYAMMQEYREMDEDQKLAYSVVENPGHVKQYLELNKLIKENNEFVNKYERVFHLFTPNMTLTGTDANVEVFYAISGPSLVYNQSSPKNRLLKDENGEEIVYEERAPLTITMRGYNSYKKISLQNDAWMEVNRTGERLAVSEANLKVFDAARNFTNRIPTIHFAREIWLKTLKDGLYQTDRSFKEFAQATGYRLWDTVKEEEMKKRELFFKEYSRRVETTNILSMEKIFGETNDVQVGIGPIKYMMEKHYLALRSRYDLKKKLIREMSDTQFYLWTLRNGRNRKR